MALALLLLTQFVPAWGTSGGDGCSSTPPLHSVGLSLLSGACPANPFGIDITITSSLYVCERSSTCQAFNVGPKTYYSLGGPSSCGVVLYNSSATCDKPDFHHYWSSSYTVRALRLSFFP